MFELMFHRCLTSKISKSSMVLNIDCFPALLTTFSSYDSN